jgi:peptidyl-prolyl cis-trans isomerase SurA
MKQIVILAVACTIAASAAAQQAPPAPVPTPQPTAPAEARRVVEEIVVRVNNEIITLTDVARARATLSQEVDEECKKGCTPEERAKVTKEREENMLRDLINQSLLVQRGKDLGINVQPECIKRMDQVRTQNNIPSMEELEKAVNNSGLSFEDWKSSLCNSILTQAVIQREVRPNISSDEVKAYYDTHREEFVRKERVFLSEIFVTIEGKPESEIPLQEQRAKTLLDRVKNKGEDFAELAKRYSDAPTAAEGGFLGNEGFTRDGLPRELSDVAFALKRDDVSDVIRIKTGFIILRVHQRFEEGIQPLNVVEGEIQNRLYYDKLRPAMDDYFKELRANSYILVKPGYIDSSAVAVKPITEIEPVKAKDQEETKRHKRILGIPLPW